MTSFRDQLIETAKRAATEAATNERGRCLWCVDQVIKELKVKLDAKLLASTMEVESRKLKLKIAEAVCVELRRAIVSGARPPGGRMEAGTAGISRPFAHCPHGHDAPCIECKKDLVRREYAYAPEERDRLLAALGNIPPEGEGRS